MKAYTCTASEPYPESRAKKETPKNHIFLVTHPNQQSSNAESQTAAGRVVRWIKHTCPNCGEVWGLGA